jgi:hypothetical protein
MRVSLRLCSAAVQPRKPSIHFLGKRTPSRSSSLPIRGISNCSQPTPPSQYTPQTDSDASPTLPTHDAPRPSQYRLSQRSPNAFEQQPPGCYNVSRLQCASAPCPAPTMLANILASSMHPPPEPPLPPPQFKSLSSPRPWERVWSGPQWYTPRPPIRPPRKRSKTATASSLPKSKLPSNDDPDPDQLPVQVVPTPQQRKVLALQQEARCRVDRIVNFGRRLHSTGNE